MSRHAIAASLILATAPLAATAAIDHLTGAHEHEWLSVPAVILLLTARLLTRKPTAEESA